MITKNMTGYSNLVIGLGEVGQAIQKVFSCEGYDALRDIFPSKEQYDVLHICFPFSDEFVSQVELYQKKYDPKYTIIHSTVPVGTSRKANALHSPIRGIHPNLYEGVMIFEKFIGGEQASEVADVFRKAGVKVILCDKQETTELGKLLDTEYYRACIEFTKRAKELSDTHNVPFHEAYTLFNLTYNKGYTALGHEEYVRPTLQPIMTEIGGHCVKQNAALI